VVRPINSKSLQSVKNKAKSTGLTHHERDLNPDELTPSTSSDDANHQPASAQVWVVAEAAVGNPSAPAGQSAAPAEPGKDAQSQAADPAALIEQSPPAIGPLAAAGGGLFSGVSTGTVVTAGAAGAAAVGAAASSGGGGSDNTPTTATVVPSAPPKPDAGLQHDTGLLATDLVTRDAAMNAPTNTPAGARVEYKVDDGTWLSSYTAPTVDGTHTVQVRQTSSDGKVSDVQSLTFQLDNKAPSAPALSLKVDSGVAGDGITNQGDITVTGAESDSLVEFSTDGGAHWVSHANFKAAEGQNSVIARQTDVAGNVSEASDALAFTLKTQLATPQGQASSGTVTEGAANEAAQVAIKDISLLSFAVPASGTVRTFVVDGKAPSSTYSAPTGQGAHEIKVIDTDVAGNQASKTFAVSVDSTAPAALALQLKQDTGISTSDHISKVGELATANLEASAKLEYSADGGKTWSSAFSAVEGANQVLARQTDLAGNVSANSNALSFTKDSTAPAAPGLSLTVDTGASSTDKVSQNGLLTLSGTEAGTTIEYSANGGQTWSSTFAPVEGDNTVLARQTDAAGNVSANAALTFKLDSIAPAAPSLSLTVDTGTSATDKITQSGLLTTSGAETNAKLEYSVDGGKTWSATFSAAEGSNTVSVRQTDPAGNVSPASAALSFTKDSTAPGAPVLSLTSDTGSSPSDQLTQLGAISATGIDTGARVEYSVDGGKTWTSTFTATEGANHVQARQSDVAGNVSAVSAALNFTLDSAAPAALSIALRQDTGTSASDGITSQGMISVGVAEANALTQYSVDGGLTWSANFVAKEGLNKVSVRQTDAAGNASTANTLTFTLDTQAPTKPSVAIVGDALVNRAEQSALGYTVTGLEAGASATVTFTDSLGVSVSSSTGTADLSKLNDGAVTVTIVARDVAGNQTTGTGQTVTLDGIATPTIQLSNDTFGAGTTGTTSDKVTRDAALNLSATPADISTRTFAVDGASASGTYTAPTTSGPHTVTVTDTDKSGNVASATLSFTLDKSAPTAPTLGLSQDTGSSGNDLVTQHAAISTTGAEAGALVEYSKDGGSTWLTALTPAEGNNSVLARQTDVAGNVSASSVAFTFSNDNTVPNAPTLALAADTGALNNDKVTQNGALTVTGAEAGAKIEYSVDGGAHWSTTVTATEGPNKVLVRQTDVAGNVSASSAEFSFTRDTTAPSSALTLALSQDTGASANDLVTQHANVSATGAETGALVEYSVDSGAHWSTSVAATEGLNKVMARQTDAAGNVSASSAAFNFTNDNTAPNAPTLALTTDTGSLSNDKVTQNGGLSVTGAEAGAKVEYSINGGTTWAATFTAAEGNNSVLVRQTDVAGNVSANSAAFTFSKDTTAPGLPTVTLSTDTGSLNNDKVTQNGALTVNGAEAGAKVEYSANGGTTWSTTLAAAEGSNSVLVRQTDVAGNVSANSAAFTFTKDTTAPSLPTVTLSADTGSLNNDKVTQNGALNVSGTETGAKVEYSSNGGATWTSSFAAAEGANSVLVRQTDVAGNVSANSPAFVFTKDTTAPTGSVTINGGDALINRAEQASLGYTVSGLEVGATALVTFTDSKGVFVTSSTGTANLTTLSDGPVAVSIVVTDLAGNSGNGTGQAVTLNGNGIPAPIVKLAHDTFGALTSGTDHDLITQDASLSVSTAPANLAKRSYQIDGGAASATYASPSGDGSHTVIVTDTDTSGNTASTSFTFKLDNTVAAPVASLLTDSGSANNDGITNVGFVQVGNLEAGSHAEYSIDNGQSWQSTFVAHEGSNKVITRQTDAAGNVSASSAAVSFTLDSSTSAPALNLPISQVTDANVTNVAYAITGLEAGAFATATFSDQLGHSVTSNSGTVDLTSLSDGQITVTAQAVDKAGNVAFSPTQTLQLDAFGFKSMSAVDKQVTLNFSKTLDGSHLPTTSDFKLALNGQTLAITKVAASGSQMLLTLAEPLATGSLTLSYNDASYNSLDDNNIRSSTGSYESYITSTLQINVVPTITQVISSSSQNLDVMLQGDTADIQVYFSAPVRLEAAPNGNLPTVTLTVHGPNGGTREVTAHFAPWTGDQNNFSHNSLPFSLDVTDNDIGDWQIKSVNLNGARIVEYGGNLDASLDLAKATPAIMVNSYLYGNHLVLVSGGNATGGADNDIFDWSDPSTVPASLLSSTKSVFSGINGGSGGERDLMGLPILLAGVDNQALADQYSLVFDDATKLLKVLDDHGAVVRTVAIPQGGDWPQGIEGIYYYMSFKDSGTGTYKQTQDGDNGILLSPTRLAYQDSQRPTDFFIEGSLSNDAIDVSSSLTLTSGSVHNVSANDRIVIRGERGNDTITGHSGTDFIYGDEGTNTINAGGGDDVIAITRGAAGTNTVDGGAGHDTLRLRVAGSDSHASVDANGLISLSSVQNDWLNNVKTQTQDYGEQYRLSVDESSGNLKLTTLVNGTPYLSTLSSIEAIQIDFDNRDTANTAQVQVGTSGNDTISTTGTSSVLFGLAGNDVLKALADGDVLLGGSGNDTLVFDSNKDTLLSGGTGTDTAVVLAGTYLYGLQIVQSGTDHWTIKNPNQSYYELHKNADGSFTLDTLQAAIQGYSFNNTVVNTSQLSSIETLKILSTGGDVLANFSLSDPTAANVVSQNLEVSGATLTLSFSKALDASNPPDPKSFHVEGFNDPLQVIGVQVSGQKVILTLAENVPAGYLTVSYADPSKGNDAKALNFSDGSDMPAFSVESFAAVNTAKVTGISTYDEHVIAGYASGDSFGLTLHFSDAVTVKASPAGDLPTLVLRITAPDGSSHLVQATWDSGNYLGSLEDISFAYQVGAQDVGTYSVDSIQLNGATITNVTNSSTVTGPAANLSLTGVTLPGAANIYFHGDHFSGTPTAPNASTSGNDLLTFVTDSPDTPTGVKQGNFAGVNAGAGNRDTLAIEIVLPSTVKTFDAASQYEVRFNSGSQQVELWQVNGLAAIDQYAVPTDGTWPTGVEILAYLPVFRDSAGELGFTDAAPVTLSRSTLVYQNASGNDFVVHGSQGNDTINVSTTLTPTDGASHPVANGDHILILGNQGNDTITGHNGVDVINGGIGNNLINAGGGDDTIIIDGGNNAIDGGTGTDTVSVRFTSEGFEGFADANGTLHLQGAYYHTPRSDQPSTLTAEQLAISIDESSKVITLTDQAHGHVISTLSNIEKLAFTFSDAQSFRDEDASIILGSSGADTLSTTDDDALIFGLGGNDTLVAQQHWGFLDGGTGDDTLKFSFDSFAYAAGGQGNDTAIMNVGSDITPLTLSHDNGSLVWNLKDDLDHTLIRLTRDADHPQFLVETSGAAELGYGTSEHWSSSVTLSSVETLTIQNAVGSTLLSLKLDDVNKTVAVMPV